MCIIRPAGLPSAAFRLAHVASYARSYIYFFAGEGVLTGPGDGTFQSGANMDRQSALKVSVETAKVFPPPLIHW